MENIMFDRKLYQWQNPWKHDETLKFDWVARSIIKEIQRWLKRKEIIVLLGSRQVGKTTILKRLIQNLLQEKIYPKNIFYFSLDDLGLQALFKKPSLFISFINEEGKTGRKYIFLDEIQRLENAGLFLKTIYDLKLDIKIIVTGSSAIEIRSQIKEHLTGRKIGLMVHPFSFNEYLSVYNKGLEKRLASIEKWDQLEYIKAVDGDSLQEYFDSFIIWGGYPKIVLEKNSVEKEKLLSEIYKNYVEKDVGQFFKIKDFHSFNKFLMTLSYQNGMLFNLNGVSQDLGIYREKMELFVNILENTFIIKRLPPYFFSKTKEISKMPKVYFVDNGIRNYSLRNLNPMPVEVKYKKFKKPLLGKSFLNLLDKYQPTNSIIITKNYLDQHNYKNIKVYFIPIYLINAIDMLISS